MKYFRQLFSFFIYSNLFIAGCAVVMVDQTYRVVLHEPVNTDFLFFVLFSTICSYSFHWFLTSHSELPSPRIVWISKYKIVHILFFIIGLVGSGYFFLQLLPYWQWMSIAVVMTFLYSAPKIPHPLFRALRKVALGKTIFLAMVWMSVTTLLPLLISEQNWSMDFTFFVISRFFLIYAICILFDYRDRQDDKAAGIRSLITYLGEGSITGLFGLSLAIFAASTIALYWYDYSATTIIILLVPGIITGCLYNYAKKNFHDLFYYFVLDGLMALSALIFLITGI